ncbi:MAG: class I SAM-dependent methyltransferase [Erythrobacteraceae bacterium]
MSDQLCLANSIFLRQNPPRQEDGVAMTLSHNPTLTAEEIREELGKLDPGTPWTHHFDLCGVETITPDMDEKFYKKSMAAKNLGRLALIYHQCFSGGKALADTRVLDVASAEGGLSACFVEAGAKEVVGVEGRQLYVDRANLVSRALNLTNMKVHLGDVRHINKQTYGEFDFTINSGILHHLGQDDFLPFLQAMGEVTRDVMFLYTHVSTPEAVRDFRLKGPVKVADRFEGYLLQEHAEEASTEERIAQVRASLDNTYSFWATEEALIAALKSVGFGLVAKIMEPHVFGSHLNKSLRVIFICKKI